MITCKLMAIYLADQVKSLCVNLDNLMGIAKKLPTIYSSVPLFSKLSQTVTLV